MRDGILPPTAFELSGRIPLWECADAIGPSLASNRLFRNLTRRREQSCANSWWGNAGNATLPNQARRLELLVRPARIFCRTSSASFTMLKSFQLEQSRVPR